MNVEPLYITGSSVYNTRESQAAAGVEAQSPLYAQNTLQEGDSVNFSKNYKTRESNSLRESFEETKEEQGLIGKAWDGIKNLFNFKTGSDYVEETLEKYENGEITQQEAQSVLEKYQKGQEMSADVVSDVTSGIIAVGAAALAPVTGGASLLVAAGAGALSKTAIKAADALAGGREYDIKDLGYDLITGSINGAMAPVSNALGGVAGTAVAKTLGLESVEAAAKSAGGGIIANLLAKGGASYAAKQGAQTSAKTVLSRALSYGADMAVDGALSGAADGFSRALGEGRIEDIKDDTLNGALGGLVASPLIGGAMRLSFGGATSLSAKLFTEAKDTLSDTLTDGAQNTVSREISQADKIVFTTFDEAIDYLNNSANKNAKNVLNAYEKALKKGKNITLEQLGDAINLIDNPKYEEQIREYAANLAKQYGNENSIYNTIDEMFEILGINPQIVYDASHNSYTAQSGYGSISVRAKGEESVLSKIRNKILSFKSSFPQNEFQASSLIGDAHGVRIIAGVSTLSEDDIAQIVKNSIKNQDDTDLFIKHILTGEGEIPAQKLAEFEAVQKEVVEKARELQSGKLVENLAQAIEDDRINVTELHNYSSKDGIAYFSEAQVDKLQDSYKKWYEKMLEIAQNGPETSNYTIVEKNNLICLKDKNGYIFKPSMLIETVSEGEKAIKKSGYTAAQMNIITKDGVQEEFQYRGVLADEFSELEHLHYDIKSNKDTVLGAQYNDIRNVYSKYDTKEFENAYNTYLSDTYKAYRKRELGLAAELPDIKDYLGDMLSEDEMHIISREGLKELYDLTHPLDKNAAA